MTSKKVYKVRLLSMGVLATSSVAANVALTGSDVGVGLTFLTGSAFYLICCWGCIHFALTFKEAKTYDWWRIGWVATSIATLLYTIAIVFHQMYVVRRIG